MTPKPNPPTVCKACGLPEDEHQPYCPVGYGAPYWSRFIPNPEAQASLCSTSLPESSQSPSCSSSLSSTLGSTDGTNADQPAATPVAPAAGTRAETSLEIANSIAHTLWLAGLTESPFGCVPYIEGALTANDRIRELTAAQTPEPEGDAEGLTQLVRWIPVGERLPEKRAHFQIATLEGRVHMAGFYPDDNSWLYYCSMSEMGGPVTHWAEPLKHPSDLQAAPATGEADVPQPGERFLPCGCVRCVCEDPERCHGCGARNCNTDKCVFLKSLPEAPAAVKPAETGGVEEPIKEIIEAALVASDGGISFDCFKATVRDAITELTAQRDALRSELDSTRQNGAFQIKRYDDLADRLEKAEAEVGRLKTKIKTVLRSLRAVTQKDMDGKWSAGIPGSYIVNVDDKTNALIEESFK